MCRKLCLSGTNPYFHFWWRANYQVNYLLKVFTHVRFSIYYNIWLYFFFTWPTVACRPTCLLRGGITWLQVSNCPLRGCYTLHVTPTSFTHVSSPYQSNSTYIWTWQSVASACHPSRQLVLSEQQYRIIHRLLLPSGFCRQASRWCPWLCVPFNVPEPIRFIFTTLIPKQMLKVRIWNNGFQ